MRRLDQGHLRLKLEVSGLTCPGPGIDPALGEKHTRKEQFEQIVKMYSEHLHMSAQPVVNASEIINLIKS